MKRLIALLVTLGMFALIFSKIDRVKLLESLRHTRWDYFALAILAFIPQIGAIALRWKRMVRVFAPLSWGESISLILASNTMNLVLPSKMGDLTKGYFLKRTGTLDLKRAMNVVVFEKMLDVAVLALMMLAGVTFMLLGHSATPLQRHAGVVAAGFGLFAVSVVALLYFVPPDVLPGLRQTIAWLGRKPKLGKIQELFQTSHEVISLLQSRGAHRGQILALSVLIWCLHLGQIYLFFLSQRAAVPFFEFACLVPLAIFIGLLPISLAGFGTRDMALIYFFPAFPRSVMFGVALYINLRYILPAIAGIPFLNRYITYSQPPKQAEQVEEKKQTPVGA